MKKTYMQLTATQRARIGRLRAWRVSISEIARRIGVHKSTVSRELKRNGEDIRDDDKIIIRMARLSNDPILKLQAKTITSQTKRISYEKKWAQRRAEQRRYWSNQRRTRKHKRVRAWVTSKLKLGWSPSQIAGRSKLDGPEPISHETVYQMIYRDRKTGGHLYRHLPRHGRRKQRFNEREYQNCIPNRVDISKRPPIVEKRKRLGDLEADLIAGYKADGYVVVVVDRKSRQVSIQKIKRKTKVEVLAALLIALKTFPAALTLTVDNGREFSAHDTFTKLTNIPVYFTTPYTSQQKGTVENTNGLLRRYLRKGSSFAQIRQSKLNQIQNRMNSRPRAIIGYLTPNEAAYYLKNIPNKSVALRP
jgi:IS30 family transposase